MNPTTSSRREHGTKYTTLLVAAIPLVLALSAATPTAAEKPETDFIPWNMQMFALHSSSPPAMGGEKDFPDER